MFIVKFRKSWYNDIHKVIYEIRDYIFLFYDKIKNETKGVDIMSEAQIQAIKDAVSFEEVLKREGLTILITKAENRGQIYKSI